MDLHKAIKELHDEKARLDRVIASLEELEKSLATNAPLGPRRRGRKSMGARERQEVSERMKKYWAGQRHAKAHNGPSGG